MKRFKSNEIDSYQFYMLPKELFTNKKYSILNNDAKVLYGLLLDRMELSRKNNWVNEQEEIYFIFTREEATELLGISINTSTKVFNLLITVELIEEEKQGFGKPNLIYLGHLEPSKNKSNNQKVNKKNKSGCESTITKFTGRQSQNLCSSNTNINNTDKTSNKDKSLLGKTKSTTKKINLYSKLQSHIYIFSDNPNIHKILIEYLRFRIQKGLQENQWKIILEDLKNYTDTDLEKIEKIKNALAGGFMQFIPSWEKERKNKNTDTIDFNGTPSQASKGYRDMTSAEKENYNVKDKNGNILVF